MTPEPCTTRNPRRRHLSVVRWEGPRLPGWYGPTLCDESAQSQDRVDYWADYHGTKPVRIADLPECRKCAKAAEKLGGAS